MQCLVRKLDAFTRPVLLQSSLMELLEVRATMPGVFEFAHRSVELGGGPRGSNVFLKQNTVISQCITLFHHLFHTFLLKIPTRHCFCDLTSSPCWFSSLVPVLMCAVPLLNRRSPLLPPVGIHPIPFQAAFPQGLHLHPTVVCTLDTHLGCPPQ